MQFTLSSIMILLGAGILAGFLNAIAGGGTLITFPILVLLGMDAIRANATSTVALIVGILGSIWGYRYHMSSTRPWLRAFLFPSVLGGLLGGIFLTLTPVRIFDFLVPYLILFATLLFMGRNLFVRQLVEGMHQEVARPRLLIVFFQFLTSLYGGYFGAGIGILMLTSLSMMGLHNIIEMNALKTVLGGAINFAATLYFMWKGLIDWPVALILSAGALPGYYFGALSTRYMPGAMVRHMIVAIGLVLAGVILFQQMRN